MSPQKRITTFFKIIIAPLLFCWISNGLAMKPSAVEKNLDLLLQDALKKNGQGLLTRIRNMTDYSADIKFEPILHDKLPKGTTIRIKRADGKYLTCRKVNDKPVAVFESCEATDAAALWIIDRLKDESLKDWLGLSHTNSDGAYLGIDGASNKTAFVGKEFRVETKAAQWEAVGLSIGSFFFRNRLSGGILHEQTKEEDVPQGEDKEEIISAQGTWFIKPHPAPSNEPDMNAPEYEG